MHFYEPEEGKAFVVIETNLEWKKMDKNDGETPCYCIVARPVDSDSDDDLECFHINSELMSMIKHPRTPHPDDTELVLAP